MSNKIDAADADFQHISGRGCAKNGRIQALQLKPRLTAKPLFIGLLGRSPRPEKR